MSDPTQQKNAFEAVDGLVKSWNLGPYTHHVRHVKDRAEQGHEFLVIFSTPQPTMPVPELVATACFTVRPPRDEGDAPKATYTFDTQKTRFPGHRPIRKQWLDAAIRRKECIAKSSAMFMDRGQLPQPLAFVPGKYKAAQALQDAALDGADENEERLYEAADELEQAQLEAEMQLFETEEELEELLVSIFKDGDLDGNGYLDKQELRHLLETSQLGLKEADVQQLLALADANGDGKIEYAEFAPLGTDIIQTMRLRRLQAAEEAVNQEAAEMRARETLHGFGEQALVEMLLAAFRSFDADNSGRLERGEIESCLKSLQLGPTKLTPREIKIVLSFIDENDSGTIEYNEFAPLMFNYLVEALKMNFLQAESEDLIDYLRAHLSSYDAAQEGWLTTKELKSAMLSADLIRLTPIQLQTVLADAPEKDNKVVIADFVGPASRMIIKLGDPRLEVQRYRVSKRAKVTPLEAITIEEKQRLAAMVENVFKTFDADGSGELDRAEFGKCLAESKLGLSDQQVQMLMCAADENEDGRIDYNEFTGLFYDCVLQMTREQTLTRMAVEEAIQSVQKQFVVLLDELMIPLHLSFDLASGGEETCDKGAVVAFLPPKCAEWGVPDVADVLSARIMAHAEASISWQALMELIEAIAMNGMAEEATTGAPAEP